MIALVNCIEWHSKEESSVPPPGLLTLAAAVRDAGFAVRLADMSLLHTNGPSAPEDIPGWLGELPRVVGFSTMSNMLPFALEAARCIKAVAPKTIVLLGGCGAQAAPARILERFPAIDFVFQGECEYTLPQFLRALDNPSAWREIAGLVYRANGQVVVNPPPARIESLDALPLPAYELVSFSDYPYQFGLLTSRGCPFACTYCEGSGAEGIAHHSVERIFQEIRLLGQHTQVSRIGLVDDTFTVNRPRVLEFCRQYAAGGWEFDWGVLARVDGADAALVKTMAAHRCRNIYFGVESGSDNVLRAVRKRVTRAQICETIPRAKEHVEFVTASFMWGFPFEGVQELEETLLLMAYLITLGVQVQLHLWSPMPRSPLFHQYRDRLVYDPAIQSNIVLGDMTRYHALIRSDPVIFAPFHHVPHADFEEKLAMVRAMGFNG